MGVSAISNSIALLLVCANSFGVTLASGEQQAAEYQNSGDGVRSDGDVNDQQGNEFLGCGTGNIKIATFQIAWRTTNGPPTTTRSAQISGI